MHTAQHTCYKNVPLLLHCYMCDYLKKLINHLEFVQGGCLKAALQNKKKQITLIYRRCCYKYIEQDYMSICQNSG